MMGQVVICGVICSVIWGLITYYTLSGWVIKNKNRICPYCKSIKLRVERIIGQAPLNIWDEIICLSCNERWEVCSEIDKLSIE